MLASNSSVISGSRRSVSTALNFANNNYQILENIRSVVGELNSTIGNNKANTFIAGYTYQDESRTVAGGPTGKANWFPFVDILNGGLTYTSFGFELFTPNNELRYKTFQASGQLHAGSGTSTRSRPAPASRSTTPTTCSSRRHRAPTSTTR